MSERGMPFGSEFSPSTISLARVLELAKLYEGLPSELESAVRQEYFEARSTNDNNKRTLAYNTKLAMTGYGLIDKEAKLTSLGERLYAIR